MSNTHEAPALRCRQILPNRGLPLGRQELVLLCIEFLRQAGRFPQKCPDCILFVADTDRLAGGDPSGWGIAYVAGPKAFQLSRLTWQHSLECGSVDG